MGILVLSFLVTIVFVFAVVYFLFRIAGSGKKPVKNPVYWLVAIVATPLFYVGFIYVWFLISSSYEKQEFNKLSWMENHHNRYVYVDNLIEDKKLIGLTSTEVKNMLGEADYENDSMMHFNIGYNPKHFMNMDPDWLEIDLAYDTARVIRVRP